MLLGVDFGTNLPFRLIFVKKKYILANIFPGGVVFGHPIISSTYPAQSVVRRSVILSDFHSEVDKVADKVSDMVADINTKIDINMEIQFGERVGHGVG